MRISTRPRGRGWIRCGLRGAFGYAARHAVQAVEAGCDVYVEKPFANTMEDANLALKKVTASDRILQVG
ncbi:MAG: Gfo/Idh/MocA family oxidoreductase, partial [Bacteroidetes bacterium]|nr:Gfo/Idh/MocA family oxidoreductase [Bacteroidota bacterium]